MLFLFIIRRLNPRLRAIVGVSVTFVGLALLALAATVASAAYPRHHRRRGRHRLLYRGLPRAAQSPSGRGHARCGRRPRLVTSHSDEPRK